MIAEWLMIIFLHGQTEISREVPVPSKESCIWRSADILSRYPDGEVKIICKNPYTKQQINASAYWQDVQRQSKGQKPKGNFGGEAPPNRVCYSSELKKRVPCP